MPATSTKQYRYSKLKRYQYHFSLRLFRIFRIHFGFVFPDHLRKWLYSDQSTRLRANDFLLFLQAFEVCPTVRLVHDCKRECYDYERCIEVFELINNMADYSPNKTGGPSGNCSGYEPPVVHGKARDLLRMFNLRSPLL